jgi:ribosomal protein L16/L10AE
MRKCIKGKGKLAGWVAQLPAGLMLFEFQNLRVGRAKYYSHQIAFRLPIKSRFVTNSTKKIATVLNPSVKFSEQAYW